MSNSIDPYETAHYEPSHLDLCCLLKPSIIACGSERVKQNSSQALNRIKLQAHIELTNKNKQKKKQQQKNNNKKKQKNKKQQQKTTTTTITKKNNNNKNKKKTTTKKQQNKKHLCGNSGVCYVWSLINVKQNVYLQ